MFVNRYFPYTDPPKCNIRELMQGHEDPPNENAIKKYYFPLL